MKTFHVTVTETDGRKHRMSVIASDSVAACIAVLDALGRIVKLEARPA